MATSNEPEPILVILHDEDESHPLPVHSTAQSRYQRFAQERPLVLAGLQAGILFTFCGLLLLLFLRVLLPPINSGDADKLKIPKSFEELQQLNEVVQIYKEKHLASVIGSFVVIYLFLQGFSLPGSMYLSILGGALFDLWALPLVCTCIATGASLCYLLSAILGPPFIKSSGKWQNRLLQWKERIRAQKDNLLSYLIVLRIAPLPPHWVVNMVSPHLGIRLPMFWISTWLGVFGVSYIHVSIGTTLDSMTSTDDFHLVSVKNALGLGGIILAVLAPVVIRYAWKSELADAAQEAAVGAIALPPDEADIGPRTLGDTMKTDSKLVFLDSNDRDLPVRHNNGILLRERDDTFRHIQHQYLHRNVDKASQ